MAIGERIKHLRNMAGFNQVDFANKIGVSKQTLYKYENNIITNIPSDKIEAIAELCNVPPSYLMGWDEENKNITNWFSGVGSVIKDHMDNVEEYTAPGMKFIKKDGSEYHFEVSSLIYSITESLMNMPTEKQEMIYDMVEGQNKRKKKVIYVSNPTNAKINRVNNKKISNKGLELLNLYGMQLALDINLEFPLNEIASSKFNNRVKLLLQKILSDKNFDNFSKEEAVIFIVDFILPIAYGEIKLRDYMDSLKTDCRYLTSLMSSDEQNEYTKISNNLNYDCGNANTILNAAHERTDIEVTEEMKKHDDAFFDEEDWVHFIPHLNL